MDNKKDYLQLIAAKTAPASEEHARECTCRGEGLVLDSRFDGLRLHKHEISPACLSGCRGCSGVARDLGVLLEITLVLEIPLHLHPKDSKWGAHIGYGSTFDRNALEAAAKAVWEWLEAEEKVKVASE